MQSLIKTCAALAATPVLLIPFGDGSDDDRMPSNEPGVLAVNNATIDTLNGVYGDGALNLTNVDEENPLALCPNCARSALMVRTK